MGNRFPLRERATIADVAAAAGVARSTVSKYFGHRDYYLSDSTRQRIAAAIKELDFRPNEMARSLSRRRSHTVGIIVASIANPFYPELIAGAEEVLGEAGYTTVLGSSEDLPQREADLVGSMLQRQVDGVLMASVTMADAEVEHLVHSGVDVVLASRDMHTHRVDTVVVNNAASAHAAVAHLLEHGHQRIAHIAGPQEVLPFKLRRQGYEAALSGAGLPRSAELVVSTSGAMESGMDAATQLFSLPHPPTAVFAGSDLLALGTLEAAGIAGVGVPDALAVVGFDDIWVSGLPGIRLTTVDSQARPIGREAASMLVSRMNARWAGDDPTPQPAHRALAAPLVIRASCGCDTTPEPQGAGGDIPAA